MLGSLIASKMFKAYALTFDDEHEQYTNLAL